nr:hypothetical protein [uncultured Allomuricauda sp.]
MDLEEENRKKRKQADLTTKEWLDFFFFPSSSIFGSNFFPTDDIQDQQVDRFRRFGFDKKQKQARQARTYGLIFYILLLLILIRLIDIYLM